MATALTRIGYNGRTVEEGEDLKALNLPEGVEDELIERGDAEKSGSKSGSRKSS